MSETTVLIVKFNKLYLGNVAKSIFDANVYFLPITTISDLDKFYFLSMIIAVCWVITVFCLNTWRYTAVTYCGGNQSGKGGGERERKSETEN